MLSDGDVLVFNTQQKNGKQTVSKILLILLILCKPDEPRKCQYELETLIDIRDKVRKHIKNSYLKNIDAPLGVVPTLLAWMEIN